MWSYDHVYILIDVAKVLLGPLSTILCRLMFASSAAEVLMAEAIGGGGWTLVANEAEPWIYPLVI